MKPLEIIIWDLNTDRIGRINHNLRMALKQVGLTAGITIMSEPPLISRMNLTARVPVLEIGGNYWSLKPGQDISEKDCIRLLHLLLQQAEEN